MEQEEKQKRLAEAAIDYLEEDAVIGVGSGRTVDHFIRALGKVRHRIEGAVASSLSSEARLAECGIPVIPLNSADAIPVYVDGADEATRHRTLIKGGGGALTREKVVAAASRRFVCIIDDSKWVEVLGAFPVAVEVLPFARSYAARQVAALGGQPRYREGFTSDNGLEILDVSFHRILEPGKLEAQLNAIPGALCNGLFALRPADVLLLADERGVREV